MFHRLRLAYNRVPKSGNSSTLMYLAELERQQDLPQTLGSFDDYLAAKALAHSATRPPRLRDVGPRFLGFGGNLRWCTVVRHPYTRLVSAFLQKRDRLADGVNGYQRFPGLANPSLSAGFSEFVGYLHNDGTGGNKHWIPQTEMLSLAPNDFDYLIYLENFACQFRSLVRDLGFEPGDNAYSEPHRAERGVKVTNAKQVAHLLITADLKKKSMLYITRTLLHSAIRRISISSRTILHPLVSYRGWVVFNCRLAGAVRPILKRGRVAAVNNSAPGLMGRPRFLSPGEHTSAGRGSNAVTRWTKYGTVDEVWLPWQRFGLHELGEVTCVDAV